MNLDKNQQPLNVPLKTPWSVKISRLINGDATKSSISKIKASMIAILIGLVLGVIPILIVSGNPLFGYWLMISGPLSPTAYRRTIAIISVFIILGAGIGVSFRTGLFNIGATGQFLMAGIICVLFGINGTFNNLLGKPAALTILLLISMIVGALMAAIPGILKAFFNVHEVVTTILLNWVIFFIVRWVVSLEGVRSDDGTSTKSVLSNSQFSLGSSSFDFIAILIIALVMVSLLFVIFKFTNFGFRLRLNGLSDSAAKYSGINTKSNIIYAMMISGAFAGLAGFIFYSSVEKVVPRLDALPTIGFEALTVALLAFSSPLGSILSGFFYGLIYQGQNFLQVGAGGNVVRETAALTLGIIIFMSALAAVFVKVYPWKIINKQYQLIKSHKIRTMRQQKKADLIVVKHHFNTLINQARPEYEAKQLKLKRLKHEFILATNDVIKKYRKGQLGILEKEAELQVLNEKFTKVIAQNDLNEFANLVKTKKLSRQELKKRYRFMINKTFNEYESTIHVLKQQKRQAIQDIMLSSDFSAPQKQNQKQTIKAQFKQDKKHLILTWHKEAHKVKDAQKVGQ